MADGTKIEWTDATWNPITGCSVVSPGCTNCYAMRLAGTRLKHLPSRASLTVDSKAGPVWNGKIRLNSEWLDQPLRWKRPRRIFVCAHGDLFAENVPDEWIDQAFAVMALAPQHTFQVLTKRAARMRAYVSALPGRADAVARAAACLWPGEDSDEAYYPVDEAIRSPLPNVWLGVSAEDQRRADERIPDLLATPAAVRFVSAEPLLGPIDLSRAIPGTSRSPLKGGNSDGSAAITDWAGLPRLDWIIVGGESGPGARPMHPTWARAMRDQCAAAGVPFFFKQWGSWAHIPGLEKAPYRPTERLRDGGPKFQRQDLDGAAMLNLGKKGSGRMLDGVEHNGFPEVRP